MRQAPDLVPVLSTGRHRSPRKGACFMEMASFLAGERWSDHPSCTHPLLAAAAREVNDRVSDRSRSRIAPLIPDVVGTVSDDPRAHLWIAREAALAALPIAALGRQRVLAVGLMTIERLLDERTDRVRDALVAVPDAHVWALRTFDRALGTRKSFVRVGAPTVVHAAIAGIAEAAVDDPDERMIALLERLIVLCRDWFDVATEGPAMRLPDAVPAVS